jgi:N-acetylneuraminic acid mutarotase
MNLLKMECEILLLELPQDLLLDIFSLVEAKDLIASSKVCRYLNYLTSFCWKRLCIRTFNIDVHTVRNCDIDWKAYFFWKQYLTHECISWQVATPENVPSPRMAHTSVVHKNQIVYINGQETQTRRFSDVFVYDVEKNAFSKPKIKGSVPSFARHTSVIVENKVYTFGGFDGSNCFFDVNVLDLTNMEWTSPTVKGQAPIARTNHASAVVGDKMFIYGGNYTPMPDGDYTILGDLHYLDTKTMTWHQPVQTGTVPTKRTAHTMKAIGTKIYLFGGGLWEPKPVNRWIAKYNDIYVLDTEKMHWTLLPEKLHICSFPISWTFQYFVFFYGGQSAISEQLTNSLFYFDTIINKVTEIKQSPKPKPLDLGTASVVDNKVYVFAGSSGVPINEMVVFSFNRPKISYEESQPAMDISP